MTQQTLTDAAFRRALVERLARMESRVVEGFMQLGVNVKTKPDERISLDEKHKVVYIPHQGVSIGDILAVLPDSDGWFYVVCNGKNLCVISME